MSSLEPKILNTDRYNPSDHNPDDHGADGYNADEWGQYRSLSSLAVVALVLGVCSLLVFVSPLLMVVPLAAIATALLAIKKIAASDGGLSGAKLARCGLALAILCSAASYARVKLHDAMLQRQADRAAQQWLSLAAEGNVESMLELLSGAAIEKLTPASTPGQPMTFFDKTLASALLRHDSLLLGLSELGTSQMRLQLAEATISEDAKPQASLRYVVDSVGNTVAGNSETEPLACSLVLQCQTFPEGNVWRVDSWTLE